MKKIILVFSVLCMMFLISCQISIDKGNTDTDKEALTDFGTNVGKDTGSVDINTDTETDTDIDTDNSNTEKIYVITVKDQDEIAVAGAKVTVYDKLGDVVKELITNSEGEAICSLNGEYLVDITSLPDGYSDNLPVTNLLENVVITVVNNNPNGTENRPFFLNDGITQITLKSKEKRYYSVIGDNKTFRVKEATGLKVTYGDREYLPDSDEIITFIMDNDEDAMIMLENTTDKEVIYALEIFYQRTDMDKAEIIKLYTETNVTVSNSERKYFKWTADRSGMVMALSMVENNNISLYNKSIDMRSESTNGGMCEYIYANENDEIYVCVSATTEEQIAVAFTIYSYDATIIDDPIPLMKENTAITLQSNQRFYFVIDANEGVLDIQGGIGKLYHNNEEYDISKINDLYVESENSQMPILFEIENISEETQTYIITIKQ